VTEAIAVPRTSLIPALPRPAWVVLGGDFISAVGSGLTLPCLFIYAHQVRHLPDGLAGLVVAMIALASLAGNPLGGAMADRWTPRRALMAGLVVAAAGSVALALARSPAALFGAAALTGLGVAISWPAQDALLASVAGQAARSAVFSVRHATMNAGLGLGALCAAAVVSVAHPGSFTAVYLADAASFMAFVPVLARLRLPAPSASAPGLAEPPAAAPGPAGPQQQPLALERAGQARDPGPASPAHRLRPLHILRRLGEEQLRVLVAADRVVAPIHKSMLLTVCAALCARMIFFGC